MKGFTKKLTTVLLVLLMLTQQVPVTRVYAEDETTVTEGDVTQANENGSTETTETGETVSFAEEGDPTVTEGEDVPVVNEDPTGTTDVPTEGENGDLPKDPDDPVVIEDPVTVTDGEDEGSTVELIISENNGLHALNIQGPAALSLEMTAAAIEENTDLSEEEALEAANELFGTDDEPVKADESEEDLPRSMDDSNIENITVKWITEDTVDNGDDALLYVKPNGSEEQSVRLQINYALSGEHDYEAGDITITIPASIFKKRTGEYTGATIIPFPEAPSKKNDFNWNLVGDNYVLTNTKHMSAATKGYIQIAFDELTPYELVDMAQSEPFEAYIQVVTHLGNTIALRSNKITAQFDTEAEIQSLNKKAYQAVSIIPASQIPEAQRIDGVEQYVKVDWYLWGNIKANTEYKLEARDFIYEGDDKTNVQYGGFIIGTEMGQSEAVKVVSQTHLNGNTSYITFSTAYPLIDEYFELNKGYTFKNNVEMTVTEIDPEAKGNPNVQDPDPQKVSSLVVSATKYWIYRKPEWKEPKGHFNVFKNGNDGKLKNNITHHVKDSKHRYDTYNDTFLGDDAYYGIYGNALNRLRDGQDYDFSYTVNSIGYIMPWTYRKVADGPDPETTVRMIENWFNRPVRMVTADDSVSIGRISKPEEDAVKLKVLEEYEFVSLEFLDPRVYSGVPKNINPDGSWKADTYDDGTFEYTIDRNKENYPDIELEVLIDGEWVDYAVVSWKSGSLAITFLKQPKVLSRTVLSPSVIRKER